MDKNGSVSEIVPAKRHGDLPLIYDRYGRKWKDMKDMSRGVPSAGVIQYSKKRVFILKFSSIGSGVSIWNL